MSERRTPLAEAEVNAVPGWVAPTFGALAAITVPWTAYLAVVLPKHVVTQHYRLAWVGFDMGLVALLVCTAYLAWLGHRQVGIAATATATVLVVDAWFDILTSPRRDVVNAVLSAVLVEVPLAILCLWIALHVDQVIARRLRQLVRRAERAATAGRTRQATQTARQVGEVGVRIERAGADVTDAAVRVAEEGARTAEAEAKDRTG